jgi:hypothetical protein
MVIERDIEQAFVRYIHPFKGCIVFKFTPDGQRGWPDRLVLLPNGKCIFIEFKHPGQRLRKLQVERHRQLKTLGHEVETHVDATKAAYAVGHAWRRAVGKSCIK